MLRSGSTGDEVSRQQQRLIAAGNEPVELDRGFCTKTEAAVKAFPDR